MDVHSPPPLSLIVASLHVVLISRDGVVCVKRNK